MGDYGVDGVLALPFDHGEQQPRAEGRAKRRADDAMLLAVYDAYGAQVYRFIYHKVGNREDAEDLTSQVFLKAAQNLDPGHDERSMLAWLYQVARTTVADHWRWHYRASVTSLDEWSEEQGEPQIAQPQPEPNPEASPAGAQVAAILDLLPQNYRRVLELRFLQGYSLKETAAAMNISEGNVKVLQYRALQKAGRLEVDPVKL